MRCLKLALLLSSFVAVSLAAEGTFSYSAQDQWTGQCQVNTSTGRQSPINIIANNVVRDPALTQLVFSEGWTMPVSNGIFENKGLTVQFTPNSDSPPLTVTTPDGRDFTFAQVHFHWGTVEDTGAEHTIDGDQAELEIHFVNTYGSGPTLELAVVGVFAEVSDEAVSGPWLRLDASQVVDASTNISVDNMMLGAVFPSDRSYYNYMGSLTTPPCSEIVTFYLFRETITVPRAYLTLLRDLKNPEGQDIGLNYRNVQDINGRTVRLFDSSATVTTVSVLSMLIMALAAFIL